MFSMNWTRSNNNYFNMLCRLSDEDGIGMQNSIGISRNNMPFIEDGNRILKLENHRARKVLRMVPPRKYLEPFRKIR